MEAKGYIEIEGVVYRLISRQKSDHKQIRVRTKGPVGVKLEREEEFFKSNGEYLETLLSESRVNIPLSKDD